MSARANVRGGGGGAAAVSGGGGSGGGGGSSDASSARGAKAPRREYSASDYIPHHDSMPPLLSDSQLSINVVDSQGAIISSEPGPGKLRDEAVKAEKAALIAAAIGNIDEAEKKLVAADATARAAVANYDACKRRLHDLKTLLFDLNGGIVVK
jgi:hypothetical protein